MVWLLPLIAGCRGSYLTARGDEALARGDHGAALASYSAACAELPEERCPEDRRTEAAAGVAGEHLARARALAAEGQLVPSWELLAALLEAHLFGAEVLRGEVEAQLAAVVSELWPTVQGDVERGWYARAVAQAERLTAPLPPEHALSLRATGLRRAAGEHHRALAEGASPGVRRFHLRMVRRFTGEVPPELAAAEVAVQERLGLGPVRPVLSEACSWLGRGSTRPELPGEPGGEDQSRLRVELDRCSAAEKTDAAPEPRREVIFEPVTERSEERYYAWRPRDPSCGEPPCARWDELGMCIRHAPERAECSEGQRVLETRVVPVTRWQSESVEVMREVRRRRMHVELSGRVVWTDRDGRSTERPVSVAVRHEDQAYWSPREQRLFDAVDLEQLRGRAEAELGVAVKREVSTLASARAREHLEEVARARAAGERAAALEALVLAADLGGDLGSAGELLAELFGTRPDELERTLAGVTVPREGSGVSALPLGEPERSVWLDTWVERHVEGEPEEEGLMLLTERGLDLGVTVVEPPLSRATLAHGLTVRGRFRRLHLEGAGSVRTLGGDSGGWSGAVSLIFGDVEDLGLLYSFGLEYRQDRAVDGERAQLFGAPAWVGLALTDWLWVQVGLTPNFLALGDLGEGTPAAHHYTPAFARITVDLAGRLYGVLGLTHWLGRGAEDPVQGSAELGVRL